MIGRLRPAARQGERTGEHCEPSTAPPHRPAIARLLPPQSQGFDAFDAFDAFDWFDESAKWAAPPLPEPPPSQPATRPMRFYRRTDVLAAGSAMSVLLFVGLFGYALTRHGTSSAAPKVTTDAPVLSVPVGPVPSSSSAAVAPPVTPDAAPVAAAAVPAAAPVSTSLSATSVPPTSTVPSTSAEPVTGAASTASHAPSDRATASSTAPSTSSAAASAPANGRFTGVIQTISGNVWTFGLWDGTTLSLNVTANTQFTGKQGLLPSPQFIDGQTVAVFWRADGSGRVADHIYLV